MQYLHVNPCRGLKFTLLGLQSSQSNPTEELAQSFEKAYAASLKQYHNFIVKGTFAVSFPSSIHYLQLSAEISAANESTPRGTKGLTFRYYPRCILQIAMKACPYRSKFYENLGGPAAEVELKPWLEGLDKVVKQMEGAYKTNGWGTV